MSYRNFMATCSCFTGFVICTKRHVSREQVITNLFDAGNHSIPRCQQFSRIMISVCLQPSITDFPLLFEFPKHVDDRLEPTKSYIGIRNLYKESAHGT